MSKELKEFVQKVAKLDFVDNPTMDLSKSNRVVTLTKEEFDQITTVIHEAKILTKND